MEDSTIEAVNTGISFEPNGDASLILRNLQIRSRGTSVDAVTGIRIQPGAAGSANLQAERLQISGSPIGILLEGPASGNIRNSAIQGSGEYGVRALGSALKPVDVHLEEVSITDSAVAGVFSEGTESVLRLSGNTISGNAQGLLSTSGGRILSYGDNKVRGNLTDGTATGTLTKQ